MWCTVNNSVASFFPLVMLPFSPAISQQRLGLVWCLITMAKSLRRLLCHGSKEQLSASSSCFTRYPCGIKSSKGTSKRSAQKFPVQSTVVPQNLFTAKWNSVLCRTQTISCQSYILIKSQKSSCVLFSSAL